MKEETITPADILNETRLDPSLRFNQDKISAYQRAGGTLSNGAIPVSIISTDSAIRDLDSLKRTETRLTPIQRPEVIAPQNKSNVPAPETPRNEVATASVTLVNPDTGQEVSFGDANINRENIQNFVNQGFQLADGTNIPSWLSSTGVSNKKDDSREQVLKAKTELEDAKKKLTSFDVSNDPALSSLLGTISSRFDSRISEMERINRSRIGALRATGIRTGSRYTGGDGGVFGSIISEEEKQALTRIDELKSQKEQALAEAKSAYSTKQWDRYSKLVDLAQKSYDNTLQEVKTLNEIQISKQKELDSAKKEFEKQRNEILVAASKNGAGADIKEAIGNSESMLEAVTAAGDFLKASTQLPTSIQEYQFNNEQRKASGLAPLSYNDWLNLDENRKAKAQIAAGGLTSGQQTVINQVSNSFENSPVVKDFIEIQNKYLNMQKNVGQGDGATDIALIFDLMKTLDPTSVVREAEYNTGASRSGNIFAGKLAYLNGLIDPQGGFVSEEAKQNILGVINRRFESSREQYSNLRNEKIKTLKNRGIEGGNDYLTEYDFDNPNNLTNQQITSEQSAKDATIKWITDNASTKPEVADAVKNLKLQGNSYMDIYEYLTLKGYLK